MTERKKTKTTGGKKAAEKRENATGRAPAKAAGKSSDEKIPEKKAGAAPPKKNSGFPIVGIGASAGGLEALETFFHHMPNDSNIAFVIIQHLSPRHKSIMGSLLSKCTEMEVLELEDGTRLEPNRVYLNPPHKNVVIIDGVLQLMEPVKTEGVNLPIDYFFRSMAEELAEKAICIILSGTATDGTLGLKAVKGGGGIAMVQDPGSAKYDGMPRSAIATGVVDFILPVEKLPGELMKYVKEPYISRRKKTDEPDDKFSNYVQKIFALIRSATGHDLSHYKQTTIRRRIERRLAVHQIDNLATYVAFLQQTPSEIDILFKDMLIGVTNFFRDPDAFKILKTRVIPGLLKKRSPDSTLRVWVVGCSTGEEAYSITILFSEIMESLKQHFNIQVFASDIDARAIDYARAGAYPDSIAADVSKTRLKRFFVKEENTYRVKKQIREMVVFAVQNVIKDPPFSKLDMVSCRNLLIYMDGALQKEVLPLCHYTLNREGILFLGPSESIGEFTDFFQPIDSKWKIFQRKEHFSERLLDYPSMPFHHGYKYEDAEIMRRPDELDIQAIAERIILERYAPSAVLVNEHFEIVHFMGKTDKYLETPVGKASFNVLKMVREGLRLKMGTALHGAVRQKTSITIEGVRVKYNGDFRLIDLTVSPLMQFKSVSGFYLILFEEKAYPVKSAREKRKTAPADQSADPVVDNLERELESTKEHLQTTIEEMETSNEELKSTNEELQSVNEELQSTNEELETSKEELQSTNEELVTVNTELQNKVDELSQANNDINNLLASTDIGTIFLDISLAIKRFTPAMTKIFNLIKTDIDRPISDITSIIQYKGLKKDAEDVLATLIHREKDVQSKSGDWYSMRISPYRTTENVIDGVVVTFVDITRTKKTFEELRKNKNRHGVVAQYAKTGVWEVDLVNEEVWWDESYDVIFGSRPRETKNSWQWWTNRIHSRDRKKVQESLRSAIDGNDDKWVCEYDFRMANDSYVYILDRAAIERDSNNKALRLIGVMQDISAFKQVEKEVVELRKEKTLLLEKLERQTGAEE
ncbi:MAG: PAS domain-containing protein [Desulfobacterales bacterium]|nr:PAS domain-containing protein [Desulfobacterales bacterium]